MTNANVGGWHVAPMNVREVAPGDDWFDALSQGSLVAIIPKTIDEDRKRLATERADILYFDMPRFRLSGRSMDAVEPVCKWADQYYKFIEADEVPATLVAIGSQVPVKGMRRLENADVYYLDEGRPSIKRMMGAGDRSHQIYRLFQNLSGYPIAPLAFPHQQSTSVTIRQTNPSQPSISNWDAYTKRPQHVSPDEVQALFGLLTKKPEDWERDY